MSKFSKLGLRRAAGACAITAVAAIGLASMGTGNAAAGPLPKGDKVVTGLDGESIKTARTGEAAYPVPSLAANGAGRAAEVSGTYAAQASAGVSGTLTVGFLIGCQINIDGLEGGISGGFALPGTPSASGSLSIPLTPGQVALVAVASKDFSDGSGAAVQLSQYQIDVQKCGGYAQARSVAKVIGGKGYEISDDDDTVTGSGTLLQSTLYGKPFSLN